jgi:hypothetical protein
VPGPAPRRGARPLILERSVHLLACSFRITFDCELLAGWLDRLCHRAAQHYPVSEHHRFEVYRADGGYRIVADGQDDGWEPRPGAAGYVLFQRMHRTALAALSEFTKIHAGCASWNGRRFLVVGAAQSGKTTLMTRLLYEGFTVDGDELVLLRDGQALSYPRRFGVRPATVALVPELAPLAAAASGGARVFPVDPAALGFDWRIAPGPVSAVFIVEPNHGGDSAVVPCPEYLMAQRLMEHSWAPAGGARDWIAEVCAMLAQARGYVLTLGDLVTAVATLKATLSAAGATTVGGQRDG